LLYYLTLQKSQYIVQAAITGLILGLQGSVITEVLM